MNFIDCSLVAIGMEPSRNEQRCDLIKLGTQSLLEAKRLRTTVVLLRIICVHVKLYGDGMGWEERGRDVMGWAWGGEGRGEEERRGEGPR